MKSTNKELIDGDVNAFVTNGSFRISIKKPTDFPTRAEANKDVGRIYIVEPNVRDNDPTKTNTGLKFLNRTAIVWLKHSYIIVEDPVLASQEHERLHERLNDMKRTIDNEHMKDTQMKNKIIKSSVMIVSIWIILAIFIFSNRAHAASTYDVPKASQQPKNVTYMYCKQETVRSHGQTYVRNVCTATNGKKYVN